MSRWNDSAIDYTDTERIREALVGRSIVGQEVEGSDYRKVITFTLDDGTKLRAHATDGGCACSNGCFTVNTEVTASGTILGVEMEERASGYRYNHESGAYEHFEDEPVEPRSIRDGSAVIRLFIYDELGKHTLVTSKGGDNGYYGWGYYLTIDDIEEAAA